MARRGSVQAASLQDGASGRAKRRRQHPSRLPSPPISRACARRPGAAVSRAQLSIVPSTASAPDQEVIRLTRRQAEFAPPRSGSILDGAVSSQRGCDSETRRAHANGQTPRRPWSAPMACRRRSCSGIWGMETNFGSYRGSKEVFRSLATLAQSGTSVGDFFQGRVARRAGDPGARRRFPRRDERGPGRAPWVIRNSLPTSYLRFCRRRQRRRASRHLEFGTRCAVHRRRITCANTAGSPACPGALEVRLPPSNFDYGGGKKPPSGNGRSGVCVRQRRFPARTW